MRSEEQINNMIVALRERALSTLEESDVCDDASWNAGQRAYMEYSGAANALSWVLGRTNSVGGVEVK